MAGTSGGPTNTSCLIDPNAPTSLTTAKQVITLQMCGNGIVEAGEECDPGLGSNSTCCDVSTCKFIGDAVCDPDSSECCTAQCTFAPSTQVCRPSKDAQCDTAEMCTGTSSACPADVFAPNGKSCGSGGLACASGVCTSLDGAPLLPALVADGCAHSAPRTMPDPRREHGPQYGVPEQGRQVVPGVVRGPQQLEPVRRAPVAAH